MTKGVDIVDMNVIEGNWQPDGPVLVITAEVAQRAIEKGATNELLKQGVAALALSGKNVAVLK